MIRLHIAYDGTTYHGWQIQPGMRTIQGTLMDALAKLWNVPVEEVQLQGASRTDAGVHAIGQVASFDDSGHERSIWDYVRGLNALTPETISINHAETVGKFNARHDSAGKIYQYRIWNHRFEHPLRLNRLWQHKGTLNLEAMSRAAQHLVGEHDFAAFRAADCQAQTTTRQIWRVDIIQIENTPELIIEVEGNAFMKNMVRIIAGTLLDVSLGQIHEDAIPEIIASKDRGRAGRTAPPHGLTLVKLHYPDHPWEIEPSVGMFTRY